MSLIYVSNIAGSGLGSIAIGFVLMQHFGLRDVSLGLGLTAVITGVSFLCFFNAGFKSHMREHW